MLTREPRGMAGRLRSAHAAASMRTKSCAQVQGNRWKGTIMTDALRGAALGLVETIGKTAGITLPTRW